MSYKASILVVEDERLVAADIQQTLTLLGYRVLVCTSTGEEAVELAEAVSPDLVMMDIHLDGQMDGIEAATTIHQRWNTPVIFLTAYADDATVARAQTAHPKGYLLKPFSSQELARTIQETLNLPST